MSKCYIIPTFWLGSKTERKFNKSSHYTDIQGFNRG